MESTSWQELPTGRQTTKSCGCKQSWSHNGQMHLDRMQKKTRRMKCTHRQKCKHHFLQLLKRIHLILSQILPYSVVTSCQTSSLQLLSKKVRELLLQPRQWHGWSLVCCGGQGGRFVGISLAAMVLWGRRVRSFSEDESAEKRQTAVVLGGLSGRHLGYVHASPCGDSQVFSRCLDELVVDVDRRKAKWDSKRKVHPTANGLSG